MLVLSRQRDESIIIADNIKITIVDIRGDKVRLGVEAPKEIPVHRREVYDAIRRVEKPESTPPREHRPTDKDTPPPADATRHPKNAE